MATLQLPVPKERILYLSQQVDQASMNALTKSILEINEDDEYISKLSEITGFTYNPKPIEIFIDSYGGYVYQGLGLLGVIEKSKTPIHTIVTGCAMSCGFLIAIAGHKRFAYDKATFMYHQISTGAIGKLKDIEEEVIEGKRLQKILEEHTLAKTKMTEKELEKCYDDKKDWYITPKQALKYGIIDHII
jgi:ATP-dependent Clp protease protease subunit